MWPCCRQQVVWLHGSLSQRALQGGGPPAAEEDRLSQRLVWSTPLPYDWRDDTIAWLSRDDMTAAHPALADLASLLASLHERIGSVIELGCGRPEPHQLACFAPGPRSRGYVRHIDEEPGNVTEGGRRITVTIYFTPPDYDVSHGGELRVWPRGNGGAVDIAPLAGRAVVFLSGAVWHQVRPWRHPEAAAKRVALSTFWH